MIERRSATCAVAPWTQGQLKRWSLSDMLYQFRVGEFAAAITALMFEHEMMQFRHMFHDYDFAEHCEMIVKRLRSLRSATASMPFSKSIEAQWDYCINRFEKLNETDANAGLALLVSLRIGLLAEMNDRRYLFVHNEHYDLQGVAYPFGDEVANAYPQSAVDIFEAANSLALERYTACVFHLMRAAEETLRDMARTLGVANVEKKDFGQLVQESRARHDAVNSRDPAKQKTADALASLDLFKDAWRNPVSHSRDHYDERRAVVVWNGVKAFMQKLATTSGA